MTKPTSRTVMTTGANSGLGKEVARQLALRADTAKVYLACRNELKARAAQRDVETTTGKDIFEVVVMDVTELGPRAAVTGLTGPLDAVVMNAGGNGGPVPMALTTEESPRSSPAMCWDTWSCSRRCSSRTSSPT